MRGTMNLRHCVTFTIGLVTAFSSTAASAECDYHGTPHVSIKGAMDSLMAACAPPVGACLGAVAPSSSGGVTGLIKCYGRKKVNGSLPDADTLFQLGSVTKSMVGTLFA